MSNSTETRSTSAGANVRNRRIASGTVSNQTLNSGLAAIAASTVRLDHVDPVTTELVRMRCAHHHDCGT